MRLAANDAMLQLLQRIRDEAHRFAVVGHRRRRDRRSTHSLLEDIPGIGPARRTALLDYFGSSSKIRQANVEQLRKVPGIDAKLAELIHFKLHSELQSEAEMGRPCS